MLRNLLVILVFVSLFLASVQAEATPAAAAAVAAVEVSSTPVVEALSTPTSGVVAQETEALLSDALVTKDPIDISPSQSAQLQANVKLSAPMMKQCDSRWGKNRLGTSSKTLCQSGCAISSIAMALASRGASVNPGTLNDWLIHNSGYVNGNLLAWGAVNKFGKMTLFNYYRGAGSLSVANLKSFVNSGYPVVINVRSGGHWVLVTGNTSGNDFLVNDPGFSVNSYPYSAISNFVVYK